MKRKAIIIFTVFLAILLPAITICAVGIVVPAQFTETYLGALSDKTKLLDSVSSPKIVIIGGSAVAFGIDCAEIEKYTGMHAVNFGLYATLGTKVMIDIAKKNIREGDIIVLAPELDKQTLSLYFNAEAFWQAADADLSLLTALDPSDAGTVIAEYFDYVASSVKYYAAGGIHPRGVYRRASFNEYGDIDCERPLNIMALGYDPATIIDPTAELFGDGYFEYINDFTAYCRRRGASVYYSFPPINSLALSETVTEESLKEFFAYTAKNLDCEIITDPTAVILEPGYFFDTNYHLNSAGVEVYTAELIRSLRRAVGDVSVLSFDLPEPPALADQIITAGGDSEWSAMFTYSEFGDALMISGVTEEGSTKSILMTPAAAEGKPVAAISANAFADCTNLEELVISENIIQLYDGVFAGCNSLKTVRILATDPSAISVGSGLFDNAPDELELVLSEESFVAFVSHYFWSPYAGRMTIDGADS